MNSVGSENGFHFVQGGRSRSQVHAVQHISQRRSQSQGFPVKARTAHDVFPSFANKLGMDSLGGSLKPITPSDSTVDGSYAEVHDQSAQHPLELGEHVSVEWL